MKFVLFKREVSYPIEDKRSLKRLVDIDKIFLFRESGTLIDPTITLVMYNGYMFEFNKIEINNENYLSEIDEKYIYFRFTFSAYVTVRKGE